MTQDFSARLVGARCVILDAFSEVCHRRGYASRVEDIVDADGKPGGDASGYRLASYGMMLWVDHTP